MLSRWYVNFSHYPLNHEDYWRVRLVFHTLLLACVGFTLLTSINVLVYRDWDIALIDLFGLILSGMAYVFFRRSGDIQQAAWILSVVVTAIMILFLVSIEGRSYSLVWATIIPPFTFFLVGRAGGTLLSGITLSVCIFLVYRQLQSGVPISLTTGSVLNVTEASVVQVLLFRFYEGTRNSAYQQLKEQHAQLKHLSGTDYLTGLYNRAKFHATAASKLAGNEAGRCCLVILDLDDFKQINDEHGHDVGDDVLVHVARTLRESMREQDIIARWGGEEFVVLLQGLQPDSAVERAEQWLNMLKKDQKTGVSISFSAGVTQCKRGEQLDEIVKRADQALYRSKREGKGRINAA